MHLCFKVKIFKKKACTTHSTRPPNGRSKHRAIFRFVKLESIHNVSVQEGIGCDFFGGRQVIPTNSLYYSGVVQLVVDMLSYPPTARP